MRRLSLPPTIPAPFDQALFSTSFGECGLAWTTRGLAWIQLPERTPAATRARTLAGAGARWGTSAEPSSEAERPAWVAEAMERIAAHLAGAAAPLDGIPLDATDVPPFFRRVYEEARAIPRGEVRTYAQLAAAAGSPGAMRAVGQAMAKNPWPVVVPCHRVVGSAGKPGGFSAPGGLDTKARLLALEGAPFIVAPPRLKTRPAAS